jgi:hypothetical protein
MIENIKKHWKFRLFLYMIGAIRIFQYEDTTGAEFWEAPLMIESREGSH